MNGGNDDEGNGANGEHGPDARIDYTTTPLHPIISNTEDKDAPGADMDNVDTPAPPQTDIPTDDPDVICARVDERYWKQFNQQQLRRRKPRDYSHLHVTTNTNVKHTQKSKDYGRFDSIIHIQ